MSKEVPEWEELRNKACELKLYSNSHLEELLLEFEKNATANGAIVHWAKDADEYCAIVYEILNEHNVHHFIKTLTGGYNFEINEESSNISQGEKQLLTIARAILKDPRIIILDEATSSVDTRLEKMLQDAMHKVMDGRTSFVIAHRLSTVRNADLILVVDHGDIVEQGTHEELLAKKGVYEKLYHSGTSLANHQPVC